MQMCPECDRIYDESESAGCPYCCGYDERPTHHIVYDSDLGKALELTDEEYEKFKEGHPEYR